MYTKRAKNKRDKSRCTDFGFNSQDFQEMFSKCCKRQSDNPECLAMMQNMMEQMCCGPKPKKTNKEQEVTDAILFKRGGCCT